MYGAGTKFTKGRFYEAPRDATKNNWEHLNMLSEDNIEKLRLQKRFAGPIYSISNAQRHEHLIDNNITRLLTRFKTMTDRPMDIYYAWEIMNVDMMTEFTFGQPYGAIEKGSDDDHMANMDRTVRGSGGVGSGIFHGLITLTNIGCLGTSSSS